MQWLVFGDDFGAHPSTTWHLVRSLPTTDEVLWVNSIGMRSPGSGDLPRAVEKLRRRLRRRPSPPQGQAAATSEPSRSGPKITVIEPRVAPWHENRLVRWANRQSLRSQLDQWRRADHSSRVVLAANPVAADYLSTLTNDPVLYLRLDDYAGLPGVDASLVRRTEAQMLSQAAAVVATSRPLLASLPATERQLYLPQGVDTAHFGRAHLDNDGKKVLGFFGLIEAWLDFELIASVATARPDWDLEFIGRNAAMPKHISDLPNVKVIPPVPYAQLPQHIGHWSAAWVPFVINEMTKAVNPLKLREYLAAGLAAACTPMPEAVAMGEHVAIVHDTETTLAWLSKVVDADSPAAQEARADAMASESWTQRAADLRQFGAHLCATRVTPAI